LIRTFKDKDTEAIFRRQFVKKFNGVSAFAGSKEKERTMSKSSTTTKQKKLPPIHPGEILAEDLRDAGISMNQLAKAIRVPMNRISAIVNGQRGITGDTAVRLARYWGTTAQYWMNMQSRYELDCAEDALADSISQIQPRTAA
jgi:addiction module HigA family antidote